MHVARELGLFRPVQPTEEGARTLRELLERLGTTFIKLGQLLSSRPDLVGEPYARQLATLQDDTCPMPATLVRTTIEASLGRSIDELFSSFEDDPLASASIAQAHAAVLRSTGEPVVVKVRRPDIAAVVDQDLQILERHSRRIEAHVDAARLLQLRGVADELAWSLRRELDMRSDAANGLIIADTIRAFDRVRVPRIHDELTTAEVLVMARVAGVRADDPAVQLLDPELRRELARQLLRAYVRQLLVEGVYHADPHPGNVLVDVSEGVLLVLDYGLVGRLDDNTRLELTLVLLAMAENRAADMANLLLRMSLTSHRTDEQCFEQELRRLLPRYHHVGIAQVEVGHAIVQIQQLALRCGVALPIPFALIGKTLSQVDTIARALDPTIDPLATIREAALPLMGTQLETMLTPSAMFSRFAPRALALLELPGRTAAGRARARLDEPVDHAAARRRRQRAAHDHQSSRRSHRDRGDRRGVGAADERARRRGDRRLSRAGAARLRDGLRHGAAADGAHDAHRRRHLTARPLDVLGQPAALHELAQRRVRGHGLDRRQRGIADLCSLRAVEQHAGIARRCPCGTADHVAP